MKHGIHRLSTWWFATMTPEYAPLTTIDEREIMRKRRLLSLIAFISFFLTLSTIPLGSILELGWIQFGAIYTLALTMLATIWINQRGYLIRAGLCYLLGTFFLETLFISMEAYSIPILSFCIWPALLISLITVGFFLPIWGPLLLGISETLYICWFMLYEHQQQISFYIADPSIRTVVVAFSCIVIIGVTTFSALFTDTTNKAVIKADRAIELEQTHQELAKAYREVGITNEKLEEALARIQKQALTDALTDLPNHRSVMDQLSREMKNVSRSGESFSLLFFDADRFKQVNDTYGHAVGDTVLRQIGERAGSILRSGDTLGRFGGEEFVILLPETDTQMAISIAERIRVAIASTPMASHQTKDGIIMTASIGIATYPLDGTTEQELLAQADEAMYIAKRIGRNQIQTAEEGRREGEKKKKMEILQQEGQNKTMSREEHENAHAFPEKVFFQV